MKILKKILLSLALAAALITASPASVADDYIPLDQLVQEVRERSEVRILKARSHNIQGRKIHVIKVLTPRGRVRVLRFDARTGKRLDR